MKNIWILNHYATDMFENRAGRHYYFAEHLIKHDYHPTIFCASTLHGSNRHVDTGSRLYTVKEVNKIPFVFVKTPSYLANGFKRIVNMLAFSKRLYLVSRKCAEEFGKPDVILASSVHPLTLVAGIRISKKFKIPCICEVRDLWPESLVAYGSIRRESLLAKILFRGEKWIYKKADQLIFTMEGGRDYIAEQRWDVASGGNVNLDKVHHINNGVDLEVFQSNRDKYSFADTDLDDKESFKVVYAGSIRTANNIKALVDAAKEIKFSGEQKVKFLIFGDGNDRESLESYCRENNIDNVVFKGRIEKKYIPYVLSKSDLNIFHVEKSSIIKYGASLNKMFEYFASGKPTISDAKFGYDIINRYECGLSADIVNAEDLAKAILDIKDLDDETYQQYCNNALKAAKDYDFPNLTRKLINVIEGATGE